MHDVQVVEVRHALAHLQGREEQGQQLAALLGRAAGAEGLVLNGLVQRACGAAVGGRGGGGGEGN